MDSIQYFKQIGQVLWRYLFIRACEGLSIPKALQIDVWEMAWVTAMAAGGEQTQSAHACDVSLGARMFTNGTCLWRRGDSTIAHGNRDVTTACPRHQEHCESTEWLWPISDAH